MSLTLLIDEQTSGIKVIDKQDVTKVKFISSQELCDRLSELNGFSSGLLPPNTRHYSIKDDSITIVFEIDEMQKEVVYKHTLGIKEEYYTVPLPRTLVKVILCDIDKEDIRVKQMYMAAVKRDFPLHHGTKLYNYPMPNIAGHNVCWGKTEPPTYKARNLQGLDNLYHLFMSSPFNNDYPVRAYVILPEDIEIMHSGDFLEFLSNRDEFPESILKEQGGILQSWLQN